MSVMLPNARLGVRRRVEAEARDAHGNRVRSGWGNVVAVYDGRTREQADGTWQLGLDPELWPVRAGDLVISLDGQSWLADTCALIRNNYDPTVDWVRVTAHRRSAGGTEPGGAWFVARYADTLGPGTPSPGDSPVTVQAGLWTGYGPPPEGDWGAQPGDEYIDLNTGIVYRNGED